MVRHHRLRDRDPHRGSGAPPLSPHQPGDHLMAAGRGRLAAGFGLVAGVAALAAGGIAMGIELERRIVSKRIARSSEADLDRFFALRSDGPEVTTPDGVVLHTEVDTGAANDVTLVFVHGYGLN